MADPKGFITHPRKVAERRPVTERVQDWQEVYPGGAGKALLPIITDQASRCMDCGIPFCHSGCPLGNLIPEWNDLVHRNDWNEALDRLHATNNFPEFTGRLCPAPCETACVVGIHGDPVTIKNVEVAIIDRGWDNRAVTAQLPQWHTNHTIAVIGSGPAGLAAAQQLTRAGNTVAVFEQDDAPGGLLRYGIPEFKMEKAVLDRRLRQMRNEGTIFHLNTHVGIDITAQELTERYDAIVLAIGATVPRELLIPGRDLRGIHQAMDYLPQANRAALGQEVADQILATDTDVVIIGGGDTGADCLGTALRQQARSVTQLEILPQPADRRPPEQPWPTYPVVYRISSAHEEGGDRVYAVSTTEFIDDGTGHVAGLRLVEVELIDGRFTAIADSERELPAQLVLLAMGFIGPQTTGLVEQFGVELNQRGLITRDEHYETTRPGVFVCGDAGRGQSLIVWAIAEGRSCAAAVDRQLRGDTALPRPISPNERPLVV